MDGIKGLFSSKTFWGALVAVAAGVASMVGYSITPEDQASLINLISGVGATVGGILAILGRIVASKKISG